jgi:NAD(P)-dependent dehydrogenase (short-subunit alcohol dehydrogenase family)
MELGPGKVAIVTGGASGIGLGLAQRFGAAGMGVVIADVQTDALDVARETLEATSSDVLAVRTDVSDLSSVEALRDAALRRFGTVHVVCNNAGVGGAGDPWHGPLATWEWVVGVNLMGVVHGIHAFLPTLEAQGEGHIVNTASMAGITVGTLGPYSATKHAVAALSESLWFAMQASGTGVGVSVLCPGFVRTNIMTGARNWPTRLGPLPSPPPGTEAFAERIDRGVAEGMPPAQVADLVADAITADRFWILTHADWIDAVIERADTIAHGAQPAPPSFDTNPTE